MANGKYGNIIRSAKSGKPEDQEASKPDDRISGKPENQIKEEEPLKNLCVKVPESWRRHWNAEAKRIGVTMTSVMVDALTEKFGLPEDQ